MMQNGQIAPAPKRTPVELDAKEQRVIKELRKLTDFGWGDLTVEVRYNGEICMIRKEEHIKTNFDKPK